MLQYNSQNPSHICPVTAINYRCHIKGKPKRNNTRTYVFIYIYIFFFFFEFPSILLAFIGLCSKFGFLVYYKNKIPLALRVEYSSMVRETRVQSQVESYRKIKKWYLMSPCLTLSIIRYGSRVKLSNLGNAVAPSPTHRCSSYWKGSLGVALDYSRPT